MVATKGSREAASADADGIEDPCAVATMTRLIHELYAASDSRAPRLAPRENDLINWSEMLGAVRARESLPK